MAVSAALFAAAAPAQTETLPEGSLVAGVAVGGLGPRGAERAVRTQVGVDFERTIRIRSRRVRTRSLVPSRAGQTIRYERMVRRAFALARAGRPVNVELDRHVNGRRLTRALRALGRHYFRSPRNARVRFGVRRVVRTRHRMGRRLDAGALRVRVLEELRHPSGRRTVWARTKPIRPAVTLRGLRRRYHTFVSVSKRTRTLRLFKRLRVVRRYRVAIGMAGFDTPRGMRRVLWKQRNPAWHVPNRAWAGPLAGRVIPPGDPRNPLKARFIALGNGIGIHGTAEAWSIGTRASHGCIRMHVGDVKRLYARVPVGTRVLIR